MFAAILMRNEHVTIQIKTSPQGRVLWMKYKRYKREIMPIDDRNPKPSQASAPPHVPPMSPTTCRLFFMVLFIEVFSWIR